MCFNCLDVGHRSQECKNPRKERYEGPAPTVANVNEESEEGEHDQEMEDAGAVNTVVDMSLAAFPHWSQTPVPQVSFYDDDFGRS